MVRFKNQATMYLDGCPLADRINLIGKILAMMQHEGIVRGHIPPLAERPPARSELIEFGSNPPQHVADVEVWSNDNDYVVTVISCQEKP